MKILLVEDDEALAATIKEELQKHYTVTVVSTGVEAIKQLKLPYDLTILDIVLPDSDGIELCKEMRKINLTMPILMLTGEYKLQTKVAALDAGADDYLTKPFEFLELLARLRALARRQKRTRATTNQLSIGTLTLDLTNRVVKKNDDIIFLRLKEIQLLEYLMRNKGITLTRRMIREHIWSHDANPNLVDVTMTSLRQKIDRSKQVIKTVRGSGYRIDP